ncbi:MAG: SNF2-related protein [Ignavibacteriaceae bacterium]|jgi:non-specific serine/threonine protein kinase
MKKLRELLDELVDDTIRKRGYLYFIRGAVSQINYSSLKVTASVKGTMSYAVEIDFDTKKIPVHLLCSCPYNETAICKHIVATLYKLNELRYFQITNSNFDDDDFDQDEYFESEFADIRVMNQVKYYDPKIFPQITGKDGETLLPKSREQWLEEIKKKKAEVQFNTFKYNIAGLIGDKPVVSSNTNYKIAYALEPQKFRIVLRVVRQKIKNDGTFSSPEIIYGSKLGTLPEMPFHERLIIDHLSKHYSEYSVDLISIDYPGERLKEHLKETKLFSEIILFLAEREVYLSEGYRKIGRKIYVQKDFGSAELLIDEAGDDLSLKLQFYFKGEKIKIGTQIIPVLDDPLWVLADDNIFRVPNLTYKQLYYFINNNSEVLIPKNYLLYFEENLLPQLAKNLPVNSTQYEKIEIASAPKKRIYLEEAEANLKIILKYAYDAREVNYSETELVTSFLKEKTIVRIIRNKDLEEQARSEIKTFYIKEIEKGIFTPRKNPIDFLFGALPLLKEMGFEIFGEANLSKFKVNISKPNFSFAVSSGIDWFDVTANVSYNGAPVSFHALIDAIKHQKEYIQLEDGSVGLLPQQWINKFKRAFLFGEAGKEEIRFSKSQANALDMLLKEADETKTDEAFKEHLEKLNSFEKIKKQIVPVSFRKVLRPYQKSGFDWFYFLKEFRFGGILADDMGLGKTIQVLALLLNEKKDSKKLPDLVVAPTSVVFNWLSEAEKFSPKLKILNHTGNTRIKDAALHFDEYDIVITSYPILLRDISLFTGRNFNYIILDESQKIKNPTAKTAKVVRELKGEQRLCLTGTPVENNLNELWSQISFLNPGMLGSLTKFQEAFTKPIQKGNDDSAAESLRKTIYPFILRRTKDVVAKELPPKTEIIHYCEMEPQQEKIYNLWRDAVREEIIKEIEKNGIKKSGFKVLEGLLRLRQICNHPTLVKESYKSSSGKFEEFKEQLGKVLEENHKVLVFSQFVKMLDIIKTYLDKEKIAYEYLTGNTRDRESCVKNFQENDKVKVFLISIKAGGFGLNLTAADYVFHYDPWWNPAVEAQATDRTHRIGQKKNVFVYKFITKNSVEEKILLLQDKKKKLVENIISSETGMLKNLTKDDINILFS